LSSSECEYVTLLTLLAQTLTALSPATDASSATRFSIGFAAQDGQSLREIVWNDHAQRFERLGAQISGVLEDIVQVAQSRRIRFPVSLSHEHV
jgi:hypothetical protein